MKPEKERLQSRISIRKLMKTVSVKIKWISKDISLYRYPNNYVPYK